MEYYDNNDSSSHTQPDDNSPYSGSQNHPNQPNNMAVASMFCGLIGSLLLCCCVAFPASILLGVAGISLAILSKKGQPFSGYAIAGLIFGIISLILGIAECAYLLMLNSLIRDPQFAPIFDEAMKQYEAILQTQ